MPSTSKRTVITGLGLVSPIGSELETVWENLSTGQSGIARLSNLPTSELPVESGGEVKDFTGDISQYGPLDKKLQRAIKKNMKVMCREIEMGVAASQKALSHSGLGDDRDPERCGCLFGCDYILTRPEEYADGLRNCRDESGQEFEVHQWPQHGLPKVNPLWLLKYLPNMPNSHVSIYNDFRGPNNSITVREASMNLAVAEAASIIERGDADVMLVGSTGTRIHPLRTMHATLIEQLASERDAPEQMARPFDQSSDGTVLGEGAGALMLESLEHAQARGAKVWGEVIGHGAAMVGPSGDRDFLQQAVEACLRRTLESAADRLPEKWHLHAQGVGMPQVDRAESLAIGKLLAGKEIPVTTAKSYFGNLGAGGAAVEMICSILALHHQRLFPIQNLQTPCAHVNWTPATQTSDPGKAVVHSSFTLQGQASSLVVAAA